MSNPERLSPKQIEILEDPSNQIFVSSITITEIMIKISIDKLSIDFDPLAIAQESGFELLDYSSQDALALETMPFHHRDPFDRMLISQAINRNHYLMSGDSKFGEYECKLVGLR
ncbi:MAG: type II toxin-antitoxin system VapC family toxin [Campylobacterales bacterium]|nr:type II toxin-antitoxin system VapC family toxin [Campylobacterales bacterium]